MYGSAIIFGSFLPPDRGPNGDHTGLFEMFVKGKEDRRSQVEVSVCVYYLSVITHNPQGPFFFLVFLLTVRS